MKFIYHFLFFKIVATTVLSALFCMFAAHASAANSAPRNPEPIDVLAKKLSVGDIVFTHVRPLPFEKVSEATLSWTNHVGVVIDVSGNEPIVAESKFPLSRKTKLSSFIARSKDGRVAVYRLDTPLTEKQKHHVQEASAKRLGMLYDTGFDLHSTRQFCSKYVREVMAESTGIVIGEAETFQTLLSRNPEAGLGFWRLWYFGNIPWQRQTVTPASLLHSARLKLVFDGHAR